MTSWKYCFASLTFAAFGADSVAYSQTAQSSTNGRAGASSATTSKVPASLEIFGVGGLPANFRARGNSTLDVTVNVSVRNTGEQAASYVLAASIQSLPEPARSKPLQIAAKSTSRTPFRIQTTIGNVGFQGGEMPIVIRLLGTDGREVDQFRLMVPFSAATASGEGTVPAARATADPNLALDGVELRYHGITSTGGRGQRYSIIVRVRNTQASATWGYPTRIQYALLVGTPETGLRPAPGDAAQGSVDLVVNRGIGPGSTAAKEWIADPVILTIGTWTTLHVSVSSSTDSDPADNAQYLVFMPVSGGIESQRTLRAPPSRPAQVTRP